jgi:8-oxo-dGTP pyrophosphatase MutT (NUDIX family)
MKAGKDFIGVGVGATILNNKNEMLLIKRKQDTTEGKTTSNMWSVPGGEVEFMEKIVECVPNFSEGKDKSFIDAIAAAIKSVKDIRLL